MWLQFQDSLKMGGMLELLCTSIFRQLPALQTERLVGGDWSAVPGSSQGSTGHTASAAAAAGSRGRPFILLLQSHSCVYTILFSLLLMHILRGTSNTHPKTCLWKFFISKIFYFHWVSSDTEQPQHQGLVQLHSCSLPVHLLFKNSASAHPHYHSKIQ